MSINLKSREFKAVIAAADETAKERGLDKWGARMVWVCLACGVRGARRYASKNNTQSPAWKRYHRLLRLGLISEEPAGVVWDEGVEPWQSDPMGWFDTLVNLSVAGRPPASLPRIT